MSSESKSSSLRWAIDELSKQKEELSSKLSIAQKREDTNSLIDEVNAQKEALEKRISSLEDGFKASSELVDEPLGLLEEELDKVDDKLEIAQGRLNTLEQEEYLEELGRKLNGDFSEDMKENDMEKEDLTAVHNENLDLIDSSSQVIEQEQTSSVAPLSTVSSPSSSPTLMKSPTNRIENASESIIQPRDSSLEAISNKTRLEDCDPVTLQSLHQCAETLGVEPEFLLNKGMQAVLRMVARNGNKLSFPLEVQQLD
jgi:DNA repair exonuclease SbcCD ATPase subunit